MTNELKDKLAKIYALVNRGVEGEKEAAKAALDRIVEKYNITPEEMARIGFKQYSFKYATRLDEMLFIRLMEYFLDMDVSQAIKSTFGRKEIILELEYLDYVTLSCSYEYFRRHMRDQFQKLCVPKINRCRTAKTKNKRREELQYLFFSKYVIESKLYREKDLRKLDTSKMSDKEYKDRMALRGVKGGSYNQQMTTGLYLEN